MCGRFSGLRFQVKSYASGSGSRGAFVFAAIFVFIFLLHIPLLQLPYFWDEAGYYVPAARDILLRGSLIPHTTVSNAHPPLVMAWIALWWKLAGYAPLVTRSAMLVIAAFSLFGLFRLAEIAANAEVGVAATLCTALYPVFFAQSSLAQVDLAAAGLTFWGLSAYLEERPMATAVWFSLAALAKETAIVAPLALLGWGILGIAWRDAAKATPHPLLRRDETKKPEFIHHFWFLVVPLVPLTVWFAYHYARTEYIFGNPEFFRYNISSTLNPLRFLLALVLRLWQAFGYLHLWVLTLAMLLALMLPPVSDKEDNLKTSDLGSPAERSSTRVTYQRQRIPLSIQAVFIVVIAAYGVAMSLIGGAVLARYMLPAVPLVIILGVSTLRRRLRYWPAAIALIAVAFVAGWYWNPPYGFSPEDNLAYRDYVTVHQDAERFLEARYPMADVLTAWPASDELTRPWLGYVTRPVQIVRIEDFSAEQVISAADFRDRFEVALIFSTKYEPGEPLLERWMMPRANSRGWRGRAFARWQALKSRFFGFHRDLPPEAAARILGGRIVFSEERKGQWVAVIQIPREEIVDAMAFPRP